MTITTNRRPIPIDPEKIAYWYFRLNGFMQIENFIVHPTSRGGQRTDADILGVRFPYRAERLYDNAQDIMIDDSEALSLSENLIDVIIAEVKTNEPCKLNGPWTSREKENVHRVLAAIGCLPFSEIDVAAAEIYREGLYRNSQLCIRLIAIGGQKSSELNLIYPEVPQLVWSQILEFIWSRFSDFRRQKMQVDQWDSQGKTLKKIASRHRHSSQEFVSEVLSMMGVKANHEQ